MLCITLMLWTWCLHARNGGQWQWPRSHVSAAAEPLAFYHGLFAAFHILLSGPPAHFMQKKCILALCSCTRVFFFSYFRCCENGSAWARFLHASLPSATGRQDVLWPYCCWGMQGYVGHFVLSWCRHTVAFQWQLLTFPAETSMATVVHKVQGCSDPSCRTCFVLSKLYWI